MSHEATGEKPCAVCGTIIKPDRIFIHERWPKAEVESCSILPERLERADVEPDGSYNFYFCRWRHLGDFLSECSLTPSQRPERG